MAGPGIRFNEHMEGDGPTVFAHAKRGPRGHRVEAEGLALPLGPLADWLKSKNPACAAVKREEEEDWGKERWR